MSDALDGKGVSSGLTLKGPVLRHSALRLLYSVIFLCLGF